MNILAIDPGTYESAYCVIDFDTQKPVECGKVMNGILYDMVKKNHHHDINDVVIEMIASYGMRVGSEVFETCVFIGMLTAISVERGKTVHRILRKQEKICLCGNVKCNDADIRKALIERYAPGEPNNGKGTRDNKGWFYGFRADVWQSYAIGITYIDIMTGKYIEHKKEPPQHIRKRASK